MRNKLVKNYSNLGQSVVEVVAALGIFLIIVSSGVVIVLGSLSTGRLGEEETQASALAAEGLEATVSIGNADWNSLIVGSYGLAKSGGVWFLSGSSDVDPSGKFTRVITISAVERDGNGDIISSGGTVDLDSMAIMSSVSWDFTPARQNQVNYSTILTNWEENIGISTSSPTPTPTVTPTPTPTPTASPTPTPIASPTSSPTPLPTPSVNTCSLYCASVGYLSGVCRKNAVECTKNGQVYESGGDVWCVSGNLTTCCCSVSVVPN